MTPTAVVVIPEDAADLVRARTQQVELRIASETGKSYPASVLREVPHIDDRLPSLALSTLGGGDIVTDPRDPKNIKTLTKMLHLDVKFGEPGDSADIGAEMGKRVYVRFSHGYEPLAYRFYRELRLLMLRRFDV